MSTSCFTRRQLLAGVAAAALSACAPVRAPTQPARLRLIGEATLAHRLAFKGTAVGGLSGLDFDAASGLWFALCDDRSDLAPARFYTLRLPLDGQRLGVPELVDVVTLRQDNGLPYPSRRQGGDVADPEALRLLPRSGTLLWTSEGDARLGLDPFVREVTLDGRHLRELSLPDHLHMRVGTGPRDNLALEGLAVTPDGKTAWAAMEAALQQDGPVPGVGRPGGPCRFTQLDVASGRALQQRAYLPDAIPQAPLVPGTFADNGVSEVLMIDAHRMLVLERAYMAGVGNSLRLYEVDTRDGSNTLDAARLVAGEFRPTAKRLVANFAQLGLSRLDNTEAMAWGPALRNGNRTLVCLSDDNFNPAQVTQFVAFEYMEAA
ncbi:MAG: esterase-like activity of phytase family protein [Proteobacteria bacterium]|nr:esterase-like activity of phytase family protein [Pseudomonadota bacterium]